MIRKNEKCFHIRLNMTKPTDRGMASWERRVADNITQLFSDRGAAEDDVGR